MTNEEARNVFNQAIARSADADQRARMELAREFFTNDDFRGRLTDYLWARANAH